MADQAPPAHDGIRANRARSLLLDGLYRSDSAPSEGLLALFHQAAEVDLDTGGDLLTTERLLVALIRLGRSPADTSLLTIEERSLAAVSALLEPAAEDVLNALPLRSAKAAGPLPRALSANVLRALESAAEDTAEVVTLTDFLIVFPPPSSVAARILQSAGIEPRTMQSAALDAIRGGQARAAVPADRAPDPAPVPESESVGSQDESPAGTEGGEGHDGAGSEKEVEAPPAKKTRRRQKLQDRVSTHADDPAVIDQLGRLPFAQVLADRLRESRRAGNRADQSSFFVHLHGPWGSGKSSLLAFLEAELVRPPKRWIVVSFNAWRDQRLQPPWWALITAIYKGARANLPFGAAIRLRLQWLWWRIRADYLPILAISGCALALVALIFWLSPGVSGAAAGDANQADFVGWLDRLLKVLAAAVTVGGVIMIGSRSLAMGSQRAAQAYAELKSDPYQPIADLFKSLVEAIEPPIAVFIDDLDRCESGYVVELLEGIQTLMRDAPVAYVVAADRKWICSSFEQRYQNFAETIGEPGRPLGYLFLDKIFQISAAVPQPAPEAHSAYWTSLLIGDAAKQEEAARKRSEAGDAARRKAGEISRFEDLQQMVITAERTNDVPTIQAARAAAASRITSQALAPDTEHRLQRFAALLEPNPRAMKRLVNAYGMRQAMLLLSGRKAPPAALARWTLLELRWPLLADFLALRPGCVEILGRSLEPDELPEVPSSIRALFGDETIVAVAGCGRSDGLTPRSLGAILGSVQGDR